MNPLVDKMSSFIVMDVLERAQELEKQGKNIIHLEVGEPDFSLPENIKNKVNWALQNNKTHYTHSLGLLELRQAICSLYQKEYNVNISPEQIVVGSGTSPLILLALTLICKKDSEVIIFNPGYSCYKNFILASGAKPIEIPLDEKDGFRIHPQLIKNYITDKTAAIFVNSPCNPTGEILQPSLLKEIADLGIMIISDEIYHGLDYNSKAHSMLEFSSNCLVLNGFSKRYAMTGLRLGYMISPIEYMEKIKTLQQNLSICAPSISQWAGLEAIMGNQDAILEMKNTYALRREYLCNELVKIGFEIPNQPQGAFYVFANAKKFCSDSLKFAFEILENAHVGITPGTDFGSMGEGFVRFSYANSIENIKEGINRIKNYLNK